MKSDIKNAAAFLAVAIWADGVYAAEEKEVLAEMKAAGDLRISSSPKPSETHEASLAEEDLADLGGVMGMFRSQGGSHE